ncbi:MAG: glycosyltransferase family 2 protein [Patescibacteria group bacterium]|jgi:glycosyltransferase involved in cell wall biosynthesis
MSKLSVAIITKNAAETIRNTLRSVQTVADELLVVDDGSTDQTVKIAEECGARVVSHHEKDFGKQKAYAVSLTSYRWVLVLDSDETVTEKFGQELERILRNPQFDAFYVPFQTHLFGKPLHYGGENYKKLVFFDKSKVVIHASAVHEAFIPLTARTATTAHKINHYSYRSLKQMFSKFTDYALRDAESKFKHNENGGVRKIFLYPLHMFWARFVKDKGYKDGISRIILDGGFAYMEFLTYFALSVRRMTKKHE